MSKLIVSLFVISFCFAGIAMGQEQSIYLDGFTSVNISTQIHSNPLIPKDGELQWDNRVAWNAGIGVRTKWFKNVQIGLRCSYQKKGYSEIAQVGDIRKNTFSVMKLTNKFDYISLDALIRWDILPKKPVYPYLFGGLRYDRLVHVSLESDIFPINIVYPVSEYGNFRKNNGGWILGTGLSFKDDFFLSAELNYDITDVLAKDNLRIKHWLWSIGITYNIHKWKK